MSLFSAEARCSKAYTCTWWGVAGKFATIFNFNAAHHQLTRKSTTLQVTVLCRLFHCIFQSHRWSLMVVLNIVNREGAGASVVHARYSCVDSRQPLTAVPLVSVLGKSTANIPLPARLILPARGGEPYHPPPTPARASSRGRHTSDNG